MSMKAALVINHVSKSYGTFRAVDDVSFEVMPGQIFAMLGPNGAGKSTTIRMILDIMKPDTGSIAVLGGALTHQTKDRIGYLPEERGLYRNVKVIEMLMYLGTLKGLSRRDAQKRATALLEELELGERAKSKVSELSKGNQQKVQFAATILHQPDILILDEPTSGLDPVNTLAIKDMITRMKNRGTAVIMSTHQMWQVEEMADHLLMLNKGQQALYGTVDEVRRRYALHAVVVAGQGDWSELPGVTRIENSRENRGGVVLYLDDHTSSNDLLAAIAAHPGLDVERFELAVPSLNDIFIRVAGENLPEGYEISLPQREVVYE